MKPYNLVNKRLLWYRNIWNHITLEANNSEWKRENNIANKLVTYKSYILPLNGLKKKISPGLFKNVILKLGLHKSCVYKEDLSLNNLQLFICHKIKPIHILKNRNFDFFYSVKISESKCAGIINDSPNQIYVEYMYKDDLALNNLQWLICHKKNSQTSCVLVSERLCDGKLK